MNIVKEIANDKLEIINGLNSVDITNLYQFICKYETEIKDNAGYYDITSKKIDKFITRHDIYLDTCAKKNVSKAIKHKYYFLYEQKKNSLASKDDKVHHLLRHLRNSVAHGFVIKRVGKKGIEFFELKDRNKTKETMRAIISVSVLYQFVNILLNSKK